MGLKISHNDLCYATAERFIKDNHIGFIDYQSFSTGEFPDVLMFKDSRSTLYEIKVSRSDFLADAKKDCRKKWKPKGYLSFPARQWNRPEFKKKLVSWIAQNPELYYIEAPHLGLYRYYVCPSGTISPEEVPESWGLYWYSGKKFTLKKRSGKFRRNLFAENAILCHGLRKSMCKNAGIPDVSTKNIIVKEYNIKR
jgi:hypothetical protein